MLKVWGLGRRSTFFLYLYVFVLFVFPFQSIAEKAKHRLPVRICQGSFDQSRELDQFWTLKRQLELVPLVQNGMIPKDEFFNSILPLLQRALVGMIRKEKSVRMRVDHLFENYGIVYFGFEDALRTFDPTYERSFIRFAAFRISRKFIDIHRLNTGVVHRPKTESDYERVVNKVYSWLEDTNPEASLFRDSDQTPESKYLVIRLEIQRRMIQEGFELKDIPSSVLTDNDRGFLKSMMRWKNFDWKYKGGDVYFESEMARLSERNDGSTTKFSFEDSIHDLSSVKTMEEIVARDDRKFQAIQFPRKRKFKSNDLELFERLGIRVHEYKNPKETRLEYEVSPLINKYLNAFKLTAFERAAMVLKHQYGFSRAEIVGLLKIPEIDYHRLIMRMRVHQRDNLEYYQDILESFRNQY